MPPKVPPPFVVNKKLILHFDIQNVLTIQSNKSKQEEVYELAASYAWGKLEQKDQKSPTIWKLIHTTLSKHCPQGQNLISYKSYVQSIHQSNNANTEEKRKEIERNRNELYNNFIKGPGNKLKGEIEKLLKNITIPKTLHDYIKTEQQSKQQQNQNYRNLLTILSNGKYQILPAFYKLILNLKKSKRQFAIVFHAPHPFKHDELINQLNLFFNGEHPLYNGKNSTPAIKLDGSKGNKNFKITDKNICEIYRFEKAFVDDYATFGTRKVYSQKDIEALKHRLLQIKTQTRLLNGSQIYTYSHLLLRESASIYSIDNYKFVMIDPVDYNTHQIYFYSKKSDIVSCLGQTIQNTQGKLSVKVDLFELLRDLDYFIKNIELCQKNRTHQIQKNQKGITQQEIKKKPQQQILSDSQYLQQTILPILEGALRLVDRERPQDPLAVIALYCLKNKDRIKKPN